MKSLGIVRRHENLVKSREKRQVAEGAGEPAQGTSGSPGICFSRPHSPDTIVDADRQAVGRARGNPVSCSRKTIKQEAYQHKNSQKQPSATEK